MIGGEEVAQALEGVFRLARFDRGGIALFGRDVGACARSFWAYGVALPALLLLVALEVDAAKPGDQPWIGAAGFLTLIIQIAGFPLLLRPVAALFGRADRWAWLVTSYNWYNGVAFLITVAMLGLTIGPLSGLGSWPYWGVQVYLMVVEAFLAQTVLDVKGLPAISIVLLDFGFGIGVDRIGQALALGRLF